AGTGNISENLKAIALAAIEYYSKLIPMGASFLADADLLAEYRKQLQQISGGPQRFFEVVAAYIEEEQQLGRITRDTSALSIAIQLLGPCFQYEFMHQFTGELPFGWSGHAFVEDLVRGLM